MFQEHDSHWLTLEEQEDAIEAMLRYGILKFSNKRNLPLKKGGNTDIYINLRQARNHPKAIEYFSTLFANAIRRINPDRIAEIPQAVSCFAGHMSVLLNLPMVTIRETPKGGRVSDSQIIGEIGYGELIALFDDVITDGASKLDGYTAIKSRDADPLLVVLVDRQQGWQEKFDELAMDIPVWSGMTLHDIRSYLIRTGRMQRCDQAVEDNMPGILALDGMEWEDALSLIDPLRPSGIILKVNDMAVAHGLNRLIPALMTYGRVMVDLKHHDIPPTVFNSCRQYAHHNVWGATIHASGGAEMAKEALRAFAGTNTIVLAVTVLTSIDPVTCKEIYHTLPTKQVKLLAAQMWEAGIRGFVCSGEEVSMLSEAYPGATFVVPGTRSLGADMGAQKRSTTPRQARDSGATHLVFGSQVTKAPNPLTELDRICTEELDIY